MSVLIIIQFCWEKEFICAYRIDESNMIVKLLCPHVGHVTIYI